MSRASDAAGEARAWILTLGRDPSDDQLAAFELWRNADTRHDQAYRDARQVWSALGRTETAREGSWREETKRPRFARYAFPAAGAALAASLVAALMIGTPSPPDAVPLHVETRVAETRSMQLADNSRIHVGARSTLEVAVTNRGRQVALNQGQAFFEVAKDPARPFTVLAGDAVVRVLGTKFDVRRVGSGAEVSVLEGRVEVSRRSGGAIRVLTAGQQAGYDSEHGLTPTRNVNEPGGWRQGRLRYADAPLRDVVADVNRYSPTPVRLASEAVGDLRVTASFRTSNIDDLARNLEHALPVQARTEPDGDILLSMKEARQP
ncbi:FecR family protein [Sphingosinicella rhizophila]|uniref:FecR domain-containing protein n=1 Tax=Sphingosinicella rhizophila TaxID=3050082 RepID=A0ABU3QB66_9SPHN|nr:FecR domain-containing protein [Sphingosinicella sp. GR2756]MDT9600614.1 FecR domain-containing protein [Sphingosinicella sp. GR2756]